MKKIFFPVQVYYPSQAGGPANTVYWLAKKLVLEGYEPTIVSTDQGLGPETARNRWVENESGRVQYAKTKTHLFPFRHIVTSLASFRSADLVQLSSVFFPGAFLTAFAARIWGKPIVWSTRGELDPEALTHSRRRKKPVLWLIRKFLGNYPTFHSTCDEETAYIRSVFGETARIVLIPNFLEIPDAVGRDAQKYLLFIGRLHPKKALDRLLKALSISKDFRRSGFKLKIAGIGTERYTTELRRIASDLGVSELIEFVGQTEGTEKQRLYANAYWTFMPSHTENFGIVVLESLSQSTPVTASKGTPWRSLEESKTGFWCGNSPEELAAAVDTVLNMIPAEYEAYRLRCRPFVQKHFDIANNIGKWTTLYKDLR